ncbi:DivIVA domain-containing protein [Microbacterium sp.]|uniref:DivIVA domain-containing protein n=1 Tax=Microbacterium sp. TaxID=51671 RepID=UPI00333F0B6A
MDSVELIAARLPQRRTGSRYRTDEVDDLLDRCIAALQSWEQGRPATLRSDEIIRTELPTAGGAATGYDADAVDDLLDRVALQLRAKEPRAAEPLVAQPPGDTVGNRVFARVVGGVGVVAVAVGVVYLVFRLGG